MQPACYDRGMGKAIQIREVPEDLHQALRTRAAAAGMSLSEYCLGELRRVMDRSVNAEILRRAGERDWGVANERIVDAIRSHRDRG